MMKKITVVAQLDKAKGRGLPFFSHRGAETSSGHAGPSKTIHGRPELTAKAFQWLVGPSKAFKELTSVRF